MGWRRQTVVQSTCGITCACVEDSKVSIQTSAALLRPFSPSELLQRFTPATTLPMKTMKRWAIKIYKEGNEACSSSRSLAPPHTCAQVRAHLESTLEAVEQHRERLRAGSMSVIAQQERKAADDALQARRARAVDFVTGRLIPAKFVQMAKMTVSDKDKVCGRWCGRWCPEGGGAWAEV
eukprot:364775-Chlamydomonas_euryale.AAC.4